MITLRRVAAAGYKGLQALDLVLPERGSCLIEGRNEAGKSTLFDAIYFALYGVPLVGDIAAAIHYGADELEVRLGLDVSGTALDVRRRARQTAKTLRSEAELTVRRGDDEELVKGSAAVTQRLQQELGGLTSEALLNSCLVAQKQLGRLETLDRSSREQALTILLNLSKLIDVERKLKPRPEDDLALRQAGTRLALARAARDLAAAEARRAQLLRVRQLLKLREAIDRLQELQQQIDDARAAALEHERRLVAARDTLARAARLNAAAGGWRRVGDLARAATAAEVDVATADQSLAEASAAAEKLPAARRRAERFRQARDQAQTLAERQAQLRELATRAERVRQRLAERAQVAERVARLEGELEAMRRQRHDLTARIAKLGPVAGELQQTQVRLAGLQTLMRRLEALDQQRRALEEAETRAADRADADAEYEAAAASLAEARAVLKSQAATRAAHQEWQCLAQARDLLVAWIERRQALDAAEQARRLMDDLALAVAGVERIVPLPAAPEPGLVLSLVLDHPLTGAQVVAMEVTAAGASLRASRPASPSEVRGLQAGGLPTLNAAGDAPWRVQLAQTAKALGAAGERPPKTASEAQRRLDDIEQRLTGQAPAFDERAFLRAAGDASAAETQLKRAVEARAGLPSATALAQDAGRARDQVMLLEQECMAGAVRLALPVKDTLRLPAAIQVAASEAQQRRADLAESAGERKGLEGQLANLVHSGKERVRELGECRANLALDDEDTLLAALQRLEAEQAGVGVEMLRLYDGVRAALDGKDVGAQDATRGLRTTIRSVAELPDGAVAALREQSQHLADESRDEVARLADKANALGHWETNLNEAQAALQIARAGLASALEEARAADGDEGRDEAFAEAWQDGHEDMDGQAGRKGQERRGEAFAGASQDGQGCASECFAPTGGTPTLALPLSDGHGWKGLGGEVSADEAGALAGCRVQALTVELAALDEPAARAAEQAAQRAAGMAEAGLQGALDSAGAVAAQAVSLASALGHIAPEADAIASGEEWDSTSAPMTPAGEPAVVAASLLALCPEVAGEPASREETEQQLREVDQQVGRLEQARRDAVATLGKDEPVDPQEAQTALEDLERDLDARRCAVDMVVATRRRMIDKVLPDTMHNTCLLLPDLTAGRYRYANLTPDYRLQVWDERKRDYVEKSLFSGGTQDQFSLALRLGFALAALPRELGTSPGFLFLDEPLSSFDRDRTAALVDLLTHGQIATFFQQVFLISHSQSFDPGLFTHHIVMEEGGVVSSTLPAAPA